MPYEAKLIDFGVGSVEVRSLLAGSMITLTKAKSPTSLASKLSLKHVVIVLSKVNLVKPESSDDPFSCKTKKTLLIHKYLVRQPQWKLCIDLQCANG